ncbi:DUF6292 family protein [Streptomyces sp. NPDC021019]|uniref:DUF6292 family protein n=1 Tax=Streptomyces sp. NPDC021019 TaxID=3365108 RepID=UPI0037A1D6C3
MPMNDSHRAYVNAVAAALTAAGIPIVDVDFLDDVFDDGDPLRFAHAHIDATRTADAYPDRMVWAEWDERDGWDLVVYDQGNKRKPSLGHTLCTEVVPAPADVAAATVALLAAHPSTSLKLERPLLAWDEDREEALDAYTLAAGNTAPPVTE